MKVRKQDVFVVGGLHEISSGNMDFFREVSMDDKDAGSALEKQPSHGVARRFVPSACDAK